MCKFASVSFWWKVVPIAGLLLWAFSPAFLVAQDPAKPRITTVQPNPVVGSIDWRHLTIQGRGFETGFAVRLHTDVVESIITAQDRLTYVDSQTVKVRAVFGTGAAEWTAQVINPDSAASAPYTFHTEAPPPQIDVLRPLQEARDGESFTVTVQGAALAPYSTVRWNGEDLPTSPIKSSSKSNAITIGLEAEVPASMIEGPGQNAITVHTPPPGGGVSAPKFLTVTKQPFYRATWFYLVVMGVVGLIGGGLHWLRLKHVRQRELERKVERRTEALREEKEKSEQQAERLEALDEARSRLFTDLSHELRTPISMIASPLRTVLSDAEEELPKGARASLEVALQNAERLESLVDEVLHLSRLETGQLSLEPRPGDLVAFARAVVRSFEPMAEHQDLTLRFRTDSEEVPSVFDPDKLRSVLGNLLENALTYTSEGGKVLVQVGRADDEMAFFRVSDTGPGIPESARLHLFDRYRRGDDASDDHSDGLGLGLALAKELTELHGGQIEVESERGMGSAFTVTLPLRDPEEHERGAPDDTVSVEELGEGAPVSRTNGARPPDRSSAPSQNGTAPSPEDSRPTLLVVEDNADVRAHLRHHLSSDYTIREAEEGEEALEAARADLPALILSDVMMPGMDGVELCRRLKADDELSDVPVVLLTAKTETEAEVEGLEAGADAYVEKPFSMQALRARIQRLLETRAALRTRYRDEITVEPSGVSVTPEEEKFYEEARAVVEVHIGEPGFTVEQFAGEMSVSRSTLRRRLKDATGQTPAEFVRHLRLERAAQLLREDSGLRVYEVADAVGYESSDHFSRLFREHFGVSPSECPVEG
jgi:signal transduction histidine kinase/CheY-like chemotaxis protein